MNICLIYFGGPFDIVENRFQKRIILFKQISDELYVITDHFPKSIDHKNVNIINLNRSSFAEYPLYFKSFIYLYNLVQMFVYILSLYDKIDFFFFITGIPIILPLIISLKLINKKSFIFTGGTYYKHYLSDNNSINIYSILLYHLEQLCYLFSTYLIAESDNSIRFLNLEKFNNKTLQVGILSYIDTVYPFIIQQPYSKRPMHIGYIGRFTHGKGILNIIDAIPFLLSQNNALRFYFCGDGPLKREIEKLSSKYSSVILVPWMRHDDVAFFLNSMKLLLLPSYSEGVPHILFESMACGTPVLTTNVGGISDFIVNGRNGFILTDNSPECIIKSINYVITFPDVQQIISNASEFVDEKLSFKAQRQKWLELLNNVCQKSK